VQNVDGFNPLKWWFSNEAMFPYGNFLAQNVLSILGSQINMKLMISITLA
jgi:hypothetical protein